jgi:hypothetical protein
LPGAVAPPSRRLRFDDPAGGEPLALGGETSAFLMEALPDRGQVPTGDGSGDLQRVVGWLGEGIDHPLGADGLTARHPPAHRLDVPLESDGVAGEGVTAGVDGGVVVRHGRFGERALRHRAVVGAEGGPHFGNEITPPPGPGTDQYLGLVGWDRGSIAARSALVQSRPTSSARRRASARRSSRAAPWR